VPPVAAPQPTKSPSKLAPIAAFLALAAMALAGFWQHVTAWFHSIF
jgi:hypothetical protein